MRKLPLLKQVRVGHRKQLVHLVHGSGSYVRLHHRRAFHHTVKHSRPFERYEVGVGIRSHSHAQPVPKHRIGSGRATTHHHTKQKLAGKISSILRGGTIRRI